MESKFPLYRRNGNKYELVYCERLNWKACPEHKDCEINVPEEFTTKVEIAETDITDDPNDNITSVKEYEEAAPISEQQARQFADRDRKRKVNNRSERTNSILRNGTKIVYATGSAGILAAGIATGGVVPAIVGGLMLINYIWVNTFANSLFGGKKFDMNGFKQK